MAGRGRDAADSGADTGAETGAAGGAGPRWVLRDVVVPRALLAAPDRFRAGAEGRLWRGDLVVSDAGVAPANASDLPAVAGGGRLLLPALTEPHVHLDKAYTARRIGETGGDLQAAIAAEEADKAHWTDADLRARGARALAEMRAAGVAHARTHVDWGTGADPAATPRAWSILRELAQEHAPRIRLQRACLPAIDLLAEPACARRIAAEVAREGGVLGAWVLGHDRRAEGIAAAFALADRHGLALDFHVDEGLGEGLDGLALILAEARRTQFQGPVLCGHAISLARLAGDPLRAMLDAMAQTGVALCALPATNLFLQARGAGTPGARGVTRLTEATAAGVVTCLGADNVQDAFYPLGRHDPFLTLGLAVPALHLDPPLEDHLARITTDAARAIGVRPGMIDTLPPAELMLCEAQGIAEALCAPAPRRPLSDLGPPPPG
jgi:cytosine deaminase